MEMYVYGDPVHYPGAPDTVKTALGQTPRGIDVGRSFDQITGNTADCRCVKSDPPGILPNHVFFRVGRGWFLDT